VIECPIPFEMLVDFFVGELAARDAGALEEHVFGCDACAASAERVANLAGALREVIPPVISHAHRDRLVARGARVRLTSVEPDGTARARYAPEVDLLVHVLRGDLSRAERVDVEVVSEDGTLRGTFPHVPFDRAAGEVLIACQRHYETMFAGEPSFRVHAFEGGERKRVGDYLVYHEWR
jgi:hypothetical protein